MKELGFKTNKKSKTNTSILSIAILLKTANPQLIDLINKMLILNPKDRITYW